MVALLVSGALGAVAAQGTLAQAVVPRAGEPQESPTDRPVLGARSTLKIEDESRVALAAGTSLHDSPSEWSTILARLEVGRELSVLERRPGWLLVRYEDLRAWVRDPETSAVRQQPETEIPAELWRQLAPSPERLSRAAELLGSPAERELGAYRLLTDLDPGRGRDDRLLARLGRLAEEVERVFRERYAVPLAEPPEPQLIVLLRRKRTYREFVAQEGSIAGAPSVGHASPGMMVLATEGLDEEELAATFVHELVHLLNQRAFLRELAPWLEEGLAEDLGLARVSESGSVDVASLRGSATLHSGRTRDDRGEEVYFQELVVRGPRLVLGRVIERWHRSGGPDLVALLELPWSEFALGSEWDLNYIESAFLVRYLLDAQEERFRDGARAFLRAVRLGGPSDAPALTRYLRVSVEELEEGFAAWCAFQGVEPNG